MAKRAPPNLVERASLIEHAVAAAKQADVAVIIAGLNHSRYLDDEGWDRKDLRLALTDRTT